MYRLKLTGGIIFLLFLFTPLAHAQKEEELGVLRSGSYREMKQQHVMSCMNTISADSTMKMQMLGKLLSETKNDSSSMRQVCLMMLNDPMMQKMMINVMDGLGMTHITMISPEIDTTGTRIKHGLQQDHLMTSMMDSTMMKGGMQGMDNSKRMKSGSHHMDHSMMKGKKDSTMMKGGMQGMEDSVMIPADTIDREKIKKDIEQIGDTLRGGLQQLPADTISNHGAPAPSQDVKVPGAPDDTRKIRGGMQNVNDSLMNKGMNQDSLGIRK